MLIDLLESNSNCQLPCFWGITPGETRWDSAKDLFSQFDDAIYITGDSKDTFNAEIFIPTTETISIIKLIHIVVYVKENIVEQIKFLDFEWPLYRLSEFLTTHGKPTEVWIDSLRSNLGGPPPFTLFLFYPKKGFVAFYHVYEDESEYIGRAIKACINHSPTLYLWNPQERISFSEFGRLFNQGIVNNYYLLPLEEATGMDIEEFYELYKNADSPPCFETDRDLWPEP